MVGIIGGAHYDRLKHMVLMIGVDGKVKYINAKGAALLKYPKGMIVGKAWLKHFVGKEHHESIRQRIATAVKKKKIEESYEHPVKCGDGKLRTIKWYNTLVFDDAGKTWGVLKTGEDVTAQRLAERQLRESEENYRTLVENIFQVVYNVDFPGDIRKIYPRIYPTFANKRVKEFSGYSVEDFQSGKIIYLERIHPDDRVDTVCRFFKMVETKSTVHRRYRFRHKNGSYKWFEDSLIPKLDARKNVVGMFGVINEVTDKVHQLDTIREYEQFFSLSSDMFCIAEGDKFLKVNPGFLRTLGYKEEEVISKNFLSFIHPDDLEKTNKEKVKFRKGVASINFQNRWRRKDGTYRWIAWKAEPPDKNGISYATGRDITEQKISHSTIEEYATFFNLSQDMFCIAGMDGFFKKINPSFERVLGYSEKELLSKPFFDFVHPEDIAVTRKELVKLGEGGKTINFENRYRSKDGGYRWFSWTASPADDLQLVYAVARDISENKKKEEQLRENESFLNSIVDNIPNMIFVKDAKSLKFVRFNKAGEDLLGYKRKDLIGKSDYDFFPQEEADFFTKKDREVLKGGKMLDITEEEIETRNKGTRYLHTKKIPLYDASGNPEYLMGISEDITERKLAESRVMSALVKGQDIERRRIADDLHDSLGQKLSAIKFFVETNLSKGDQAVENSQRLNAMLNETIEEVRNISHNLMPAVIEDFGLTNALLDLCNKSSKANCTIVKFQAYDVKAAMEKSVKFGVYRMAQELVNNALKHAGAKEVSVQLFQRDKMIILIVEDDGRGFNPKKTNFEKTLGINSITSRAKALNGIFNLDSEPGNGTIASVEIPLKK